MTDQPDNDEDADALTPEEHEAFLKVTVDAMAFAMAANDPEFGDRLKVEAGEIEFPHRYQVMAIHALHAMMAEGWGFVGNDEPLAS